MWSGVVLETLPEMRRLAPPGSRILEVGYGDGILSCWLAAELGWSITGLDIDPANAAAARAEAAARGLEGRTDFRLCRPEDTFRHSGTYDAVFIKTVVYSAPTLAEYATWLDWIVSVLPPRGVLINFETGKAGALAQAYRRLRRRVYSDLQLYTSEVEALYAARFDLDYRRYYGGVSQFLAPVPGLYEAAAWIERTVSPRTPDNCFVAALAGRVKP